MFEGSKLGGGNLQFNCITVKRCLTYSEEISTGSNIVSLRALPVVVVGEKCPNLN